MNTTMRAWPLDAYCGGEYHDPVNRRFHAQPVACPACGPGVFLREEQENVAKSWAAIECAAELLREGKIVAVKGLGGYHLACDARNPASNAALRERKYRKEKPFAVMARDIEVARQLIALTPDAEALLTSQARPIVLATARIELEGVAPENRDLGVMLPYTPLQHLLFAAGAPDALVMTSANRSSEPIAYEDDDALQRLSGIADAFLIGERPIARRVDDSVTRAGMFGPVVLRRSRGYAPTAVAQLPIDRPVLAVGADLKNTITLVVDGQAFVSQHIGDLSHYQAFQAFVETIKDLISMYDIRTDDLLLVHDAHPQYVSAGHASALPVQERHAIQHHRAHLASVLAERGEWKKEVVGVSFDGTGFGDDGTIWGGEIFHGSLESGFERVAHLRPAALPGGDAAAQYPVKAASGFLAQIDDLPDLTQSPFHFGSRYQDSMKLIQRGVRTFSTTSVGRLFDAVAALLGFARESTFEGQAAIWLEQQARGASNLDAYPFPLRGETGLPSTPPGGRLGSSRPSTGAGDCARVSTRHRHRLEPSRRRTLPKPGSGHGCVLRRCLPERAIAPGSSTLLLPQGLDIWTNHAVPPNDGGISLGQAALAAFGQYNDAALSDVRGQPMHELSIALSIVDMAQEEAERRNVQVEAVHLELGALSGVVGGASLLLWDSLRWHPARRITPRGQGRSHRSLLPRLRRHENPAVYAVVSLPRLRSCNL